MEIADAGFDLIEALMCDNSTERDISIIEAVKVLGMINACWMLNDTKMYKNKSRLRWYVPCFTSREGFVHS